MKLAFAGGGTGGHLAPAIALREELEARQDGSAAIFLTAVPDAAALEKSAVGSRVFPLPAAALSPRRWWTAPRRLLINFRAYRRARKIFQSWKPDLVLGLGGYVSVPPVLAARRLQIPAVCHEQNRVLGRANRLLARGPVRVISTFGLSSPVSHPDRSVRLGSPLRRAAREAAREGTAAGWGLVPGRFTVLVLGGSRGAQAINRLLAAAAGGWSDSEEKGKIQFIHCAGAADVERLRRVYRERCLAAAVFGTLPEIGWAYSLADLAVSRAGGATLGEIAYWGIPSILIPYPYATDGHQLANADYFAAAGAATVWPEWEANPDRLVREIVRLRGEPRRRQAMAAAARGLNPGGAAEKTLDYLQKILEDGNEPG